MRQPQRGRFRAIWSGLAGAHSLPGHVQDYWPVRIDRGGAVLAPGDPNDLVRYIDARDLGEWCVHMLEQREPGVYNAVGPRSHLTIAEMLYGIRAITSVAISFAWVNADFSAEHGVRPWSWAPGMPGTLNRNLFGHVV